MYPPPWRGFSSISRGPDAVSRTSVWLMPCVSPTAASTAGTWRSIASRSSAASGAGNRWPDSTNPDPPSTPGSATDLAVMPSTRVTPSRVTDSTLYSGPSRTRSSSASRSSGWSRVLRSGPVASAKATARPASSATLRTPVPEFMSTGLTTSG